MMRATKWKLEKAKVKVVFRLQFHATNIPQSGWDKLFICLVPTESGKIIAKTSKANVRNGTCKWADPIYETTRLLQDSRNKQIDDKFYTLIVGMGTSRASILGETSINLAEYADASSPLIVGLPLDGSENGTILHVTVQLLTAKTGFREFEQQFDRGMQSSSNLNREVEPTFSALVSEDHGIKVNTETNFGLEPKELITIVEETEIHEEYSDKHELPSIHEAHDSNGSTRIQSPPTDYPINNDLAIAQEENHKLRQSLKMTESSISELKQELSSLHKHANEMETETQKIAQHLMTEISSGQKLEREIRLLKSECSKFKDELEQLKVKKSIEQSVESRIVNQGFDSNFQLLNEINEVKTEKGNLIRKMDEMECYYEALVQELEENQKRILGEFQSLRYEHSNCVYTISTCKAETELTRRDMNSQILRFIEERQTLGCVNEELTKRVNSSELRVRELERINGEFKSLKNEHSTCAEMIKTCRNETELVRRDLSNQTLKFAKERHALGCLNEELEKRVANYEARIVELEENRERILEEFESLRNEHLTCGETILTCKGEIEMLKCNEKGDLGCVDEEIEEKVMVFEAHVKELEKDRERILGEFESLKNEHLTCVDSILTGKSESELIRGEMDDKLSKLVEEKHDLECAKEEVEKDRERILEEFESFKNEHLTCGDIILTCKSELETIRNEMNDQISKLMEEKHELDRVNKELIEKVMNFEANVQELEKNRVPIIGEFESLKHEHSTCGGIISTLKSEVELIRNEMNDKISKLTKERQDLDHVNEELEKKVVALEERVQELEKNRECILGEYESLKNEHSTCVDSILTSKSETESVRDEMNEKISNLNEEKRDLELVKEELEKKRECILEEFEIFKNEHSTCSDTISNCKSEIESMRNETNDKISKFTEEKRDLERAKEELEKRVTNAESALARARSNYSSAVTQLKKDLEMLSSQVASMYETNQNLIKGTFQESLINENDYEKQETKNSESESLRMAFMKEQCETTVQELKQQLLVSKRDGDNILFKLQDALDEIESRKKSEASYLKKIEELSVKIMGLEAELESINADLECAVLNVECCKEEKEKMVAIMEECEEEKMKISFELSLYKEQLAMNERHADMDSEVKNKYVKVESELKEMHERYSQLSLQFAEVEGERQKLMMTVKNSRSPSGKAR